MARERPVEVTAVRRARRVSAARAVASRRRNAAAASRETTVQLLKALAVEASYPIDRIHFLAKRILDEGTKQ